MNTKNCIICVKKINKSDILLNINKDLYSKYNRSINETYIEQINDILYNKKNINFLNYCENFLLSQNQCFFKRLYYLKEYKYKWIYLMKIQIFRIVYPIPYFSKISCIYIKFFRLKKKFQKRAINNLLNNLSETELEKMNFKLEDYENIKSIIEEKKLKNSRILLKQSLWEDSKLNKADLFKFSHFISIKKKKHYFIKKKESNTLVSYWLNSKVIGKKFPSFIKSMTLKKIKNEFKLPNKSLLMLNLNKKLKLNICLPSRFHKKSINKYKKYNKLSKSKSPKIYIKNKNYYKHKYNISFNKKNNKQKIFKSYKFFNLKKTLSSTRIQRKNSMKISKIINKFWKTENNEKIKRSLDKKGIILNRSIKNLSKKTISVSRKITKRKNNYIKLKIIKIKPNNIKSKLKQINPFNNIKLRKTNWKNKIKKISKNSYNKKYI